MAHYYFIPAALPPLTLGAKPEISFKELREMLSMNLTRADFKTFKRLLRSVDLYNIKALWLGLPLDDRGNFNAKDLEEALLVRDSLPMYLSEYLERYESASDRIRYFSSLYASLYRDEETGFLGKYFHLEREINLILTALRAKKSGRDVARELQFEDPFDPFVAQILAQKDAPDYAPPHEYEELKALFLANSQDPKKLAFAILEYRFKKIEEFEENEHFTLDQILAYAARLLIVESWDRLDKERGSIAVEELSKYG
jgi:hypothetical protein